MNEFAAVALTAIFSSNIISSAGVGTATLQSEKRSFWFMVVSSLCVIVSTILSGLLVSVLNTYVFAKFDLEYLRLFVAVLLAVIMAFLSRTILKFASQEMFYLYEKSYSFPIQTAINVGTILVINYATTFLKIMFELAMFCVGFLLVQILFYPLYERLDSVNSLKPARNIPLMFFTLSIVGIILYVVGLIL